MPSSFENWQKEVARRAEARAKEEATYETGRAGEQSAYDAWQQYAGGAPQRQSAYEANWLQGEAQRRKTWMQARKRPQAPVKASPWLGSKPPPGGYQDIGTGAWSPGRPTRIVPDPRRGKPFKPGTMPAWGETLPPPPGVRPQRKPYDPRTTTPIAGQGRAREPTMQYGAQFLEPYGRDVLGMSPQMSPLQRAMNFTDVAYGPGDLQYGSQAARDYFAKSLGDYFKGQQSTGDYSAFGESRSLQEAAKNRLGLSYTGYEDLQAQLADKYGYVNR